MAKKKKSVLKVGTREALNRMDCEIYKDFFAKCIKVILPRIKWNDDISVGPFDDDDRLQIFLSSFNEYKQDDIVPKSPMNTAIKDYVRCNAGFAGKKPRLRLRKKRASYLYRQAKRELKAKCASQQKPLQGLLLFYGCVRRIYFNNYNDCFNQNTRKQR